MKRALQSPLRQIVENAGLDGAVVAGKLLENEDTNHGFDAQKLEYVDMIKAGIIDPTKVVRCALQDAASVASLLITTEAIICDMPEDKKSDGSTVWAAAWVAWAVWETWASRLSRNRPKTEGARPQAGPFSMAARRVAGSDPHVEATHKGPGPSSGAFVCAMSGQYSLRVY